ncbi:hypothetical protein [Klebsiella pneumoniae IS43]|uniref:Uncharacterized protein n=1 Tax=Klebsiella pneumoniae IS43 TaxID=1432552 RepID=W1DSS3_KLEPN|nr:hypothetical protein [Klebsiella pneumoniae IS43]
MIIPATLYVAFQRGHYKQLAEFTKWAQKRSRPQAAPFF